VPGRIVPPVAGLAETTCVKPDPRTAASNPAVTALENHAERRPPTERAVAASRAAKAPSAKMAHRYADLANVESAQVGELPQGLRGREM
jgi:hypothetical protein